MKYILILFFAFSFIGFAMEWAFRVLTDNAIEWKAKLKQLKLLLMMPVYGSACIVIELVYRIPIMQKITYLPLLIVCGGLIATLFELGFGMLFNKVLKLDIWDYSHSYIMIGKKKIQLNIMGQIDLFHSLLWCALTIAVCYFSKIIEWMAI